MYPKLWNSQKTMNTSKKSGTSTRQGTHTQGTSTHQGTHTQGTSTHGPPTQSGSTADWRGPKKNQGAPQQSNTPPSSTKDQLTTGPNEWVPHQGAPQQSNATQLDEGQAPGQSQRVGTGKWMSKSFARAKEEAAAAMRDKIDAVFAEAARRINEAVGSSNGNQATRMALDYAIDKFLEYTEMTPPPRDSDAFIMLARLKYEFLNEKPPSFRHWDNTMGKVIENLAHVFYLGYKRVASKVDERNDRGTSTRITLSEIMALIDDDAKRLSSRKDRMTRAIATKIERGVPHSTSQPRVDSSTIAKSVDSTVLKVAESFFDKVMHPFYVKKTQRTRVPKDPASQAQAFYTPKSVHQTRDTLAHVCITGGAPLSTEQLLLFVKLLRLEIDSPGSLISIVDRKTLSSNAVSALCFTAEQMTAIKTANDSCCATRIISAVKKASKSSNSTEKLACLENVGKAKNALITTIALVNCYRESPTTSVVPLMRAEEKARYDYDSALKELQPHLSLFERLNAAIKQWLGVVGKQFSKAYRNSHEFLSLLRKFWCYTNYAVKEGEGFAPGINMLRALKRTRVCPIGTPDNICRDNDLYLDEKPLFTTYREFWDLFVEVRHSNKVNFKNTKPLTRPQLKQFAMKVLDVIGKYFDDSSVFDLANCDNSWHLVTPELIKEAIANKEYAGQASDCHKFAFIALLNGSRSHTGMQFSIDNRRRKGTNPDNSVRADCSLPTWLRDKLRGVCKKLFPSESWKQIYRAFDFHLLHPDAGTESGKPITNEFAAVRAEIVLEAKYARMHRDRAANIAARQALYREELYNAPPPSEHDVGRVAMIQRGISFDQDYGGCVADIINMYLDGGHARHKVQGMLDALPNTNNFKYLKRILSKLFKPLLCNVANCGCGDRTVWGRYNTPSSRTPLMSRNFLTNVITHAIGLDTYRSPVPVTPPSDEISRPLMKQLMDLARDGNILILNDRYCSYFHKDFLSKFPRGLDGVMEGFAGYSFVAACKFGKVQAGIDDEKRESYLKRTTSENFRRDKEKAAEDSQRAKNPPLLTHSVCARNASGPLRAPPMFTPATHQTTPVYDALMVAVQAVTTKIALTPAPFKSTVNVTIVDGTMSTITGEPFHIAKFWTDVSTIFRCALDPGLIFDMQNPHVTSAVNAYFSNSRENFGLSPDGKNLSATFATSGHVFVHLTSVQRTLDKCEKSKAAANVTETRRPVGLPTKHTGGTRAATHAGNKHKKEKKARKQQTR